MLKVSLVNSFSKINSTPANKPVNKIVSTFKNAQASSLNVLSSYAKAGISFSGKKQVKSQVSVQSLQEKLNGLDIDCDAKERLDSYFDIVDASDKEALSFIDRVFSEPKLYKNGMITSSIYEVLDTANLEVANKVVDKYLSDSKFYDNKWFQDFFGDAIEIVSTEDRFKLFDKFTDKSALYRNKALKQQICPIIQSVDTEDNYKLADKLLSNKAWYKNAQLVEDFYMIIDVFTEEDVLNFYGIEGDSDDSDVLGGGPLFVSVEVEAPVIEENIIEEEPIIQEDKPVEQPVIEPKPIVAEEPLGSKEITRRAEQKAESINESMLICGFIFDIDDLKETLAEPTPSKESSPYQRLMKEGKRYYGYKNLEDM